MKDYSTTITVKAESAEEATKKIAAVIKILTSPYLNTAELEKIATLSHNRFKMIQVKPFI